MPRDLTDKLNRALRSVFEHVVRKRDFQIGEQSDAQFFRLPFDHIEAYRVGEAPIMIMPESDNVVIDALSDKTDDTMDVVLALVKQFDPQARWAVEMPGSQPGKQGFADLNGRVLSFSVRRQPVDFRDADGNQFLGVRVYLEAKGEEFVPGWHRPVPAST